LKINGERFVPADRAAVWDALNDPQVLKACIPGCDSIEANDGGGFTMLMTARVGPVTAKFKGRIVLSDLNPPTSYKLAFEGQGGVAGFGKGTADVILSEARQESVKGTLLRYEAAAQVGGKLAQIGSRLIDATAAKMAEEFFGSFVGRFKPVVETVAPEPASFWQQFRAWVSRLLSRFSA
jgi:carbon monoxide dehydrogenase subunit G